MDARTLPEKCPEIEARAGTALRVELPVVSEAQRHHGRAGDLLQPVPLDRQHALVVHRGAVALAVPSLEPRALPALQPAGGRLGARTKAQPYAGRLLPASLAGGVVAVSQFLSFPPYPPRNCAGEPRSLSRLASVARTAGN